ncbi:MAG: hypothetical protein JKY48_12365 [Flavobacteriales bacterium]|nr:hypothetical protein [Flavobacteriales bacterium]
MKKIAIIILIMITVTPLYSQVIDTSFFPKFVPYSPGPIIDWNDFIVGSWADPTVLKVNNEYIMYASAMHGGIATPQPISIYRFTSLDGYSWGMNPSTPVFEPVNGTFYEGGLETPNVVFFKGEYHMYNTVYLQNIPFQFKISHATSLNGINWTMDSTQILEPDSSVNWMSEIVAEPGALVKNDTLYLFYTAISNVGNVSIGLVRSIDGNSFFDTSQVVTIPRDVYPVNDGYLGLSTPDATLVGDTIYLFTDLVRSDTYNDWNQVGLHQFKSYGDINKWYHDTSAIHISSDFTWTDGNYLSQLLGATPLMDGNRLRLWYWGYDLAQIDTILNDTLYHVHLVGSDLHPDTIHWGIGTSEYVFPNMTAVDKTVGLDQNISIKFYNNRGLVETKNNLESTLNIYSLTGQLLYRNTFKNTHNFNIDYAGLIFNNVTNGNSVLTHKYISF